MENLINEHLYVLSETQVERLRPFYPKVKKIRKQLLGQRLFARDLDRQVAEFQVGSSS